MIIDIIKNPVVIGLLFGTLAYFYMEWSNERRYKKDPNYKKTVGVLTPLVIGIISALIAYGIMDEDIQNMQAAQTIPVVSDAHGGLSGIHGGLSKIELDGISKSYKLSKIDVSSAIDSPKSYTLVSKGLNIPNNVNLPDVYIE